MVRQFIALARQGAGGDVGEQAALGAGFLTRQEDPRGGALASRRVPERRGRRQIRRAQPGIGRGAASGPRGRGGLPQEDRGVGGVEIGNGGHVPGIVGRRALRLADRPLRHECALVAVGTHPAKGRSDLVIHQHREGAIAIVIGTQAVRDAHHLIGRTRGRLANRKERLHHHTGGDRQHIAVGVSSVDGLDGGRSEQDGGHEKAHNVSSWRWRCAQILAAPVKTRGTPCYRRAKAELPSDHRARATGPPDP